MLYEIFYFDLKVNNKSKKRGLTVWYIQESIIHRLQRIDPHLMQKLFLPLVCTLFGYFQRFAFLRQRFMFCFEIRCLLFLQLSFFESDKANKYPTQAENQAINWKEKFSATIYKISVSAFLVWSKKLTKPQSSDNLLHCYIFYWYWHPFGFNLDNCVLLKLWIEMSQFWSLDDFCLYRASEHEENDKCFKLVEQDSSCWSYSVLV